MLKLKINKKDIELVEEEYFVRGTVGAKCVVMDMDEYWMSDEHAFDLIPVDPQTQETIDVETTGSSVALVFKRSDGSPIKVYLIDYHEDINSLETFKTALAANDKARGESEGLFAVDIPYEVMANKGRFKVGFFMSLYYAYEDENGNIIESCATTPTLWSENIQVKNGTDTDGTTATQYTPTELEQLQSAIVKKQDKLTAGENITITDDNVISAQQTDLSNCTTLKTSRVDYFLYLDDLSSQDAIAELNLTDTNGEISQNGTLMIIDSENEIVNKTKCSYCKYPWGPRLITVYDNGEYDDISTTLTGDSKIKYINLYDGGVDACTLPVNLQDGVEYSIYYNAYTEAYNYEGSSGYYNIVDYFFIVPTDSIKKISYTKGTWDNIKRKLTGENMLTGKPVCLFDEKSKIEVKYSPCSQYTAMKDYVDDTVDELKEDMANSEEITNIKENLSTLTDNFSTLTDNVSLLSNLVNAKSITTVGVSAGCKYTFDWNAMYFMKSNTGKTDITLLDSDGNNIIGSLKCSYCLLILPKESYVRSEWTSKYDPSDPNYDDGNTYIDGNRKESKLHGLFAGMTDKTALVTTDKIQMLQFDLDPDKTVSITPSAESVIVYKIKF